MRVVIVGGGFAGLFTASRLLAAGVDDVVVVEASDEPGGVARSVTRDGYVLEPGAGSFLLPHPNLSRVLADSDLVPAAATARHVWTGTRLITPGAGPRGVLAPLVPLRAKLRGLLEPLVSEPPGDNDESLDRFCRRRLGDTLGRTVAWLAASGIFAGDPARLSAEAAFPAVIDLVRREGSLVGGGIRRLRSRPRDAVRPSVQVPATTMADLAAHMATRLDGRFRRGHRVEAVRRTADGWTVSGDEQLKADHVVLAVAPHVAAGLVTGSLAEALGGAEAAPVVVVGLGGPDMSIPAGFGILTGPDAGTATRGILLESSYAPHRAPAGASLVKVIAGGAPGRPLLDLDDAGLVEVIGAEVAQVLRTDLDVTFTEVIRHRHGIPQYVIGHRRWLASVESATCESMHLTGWGYRGVGMAHLATDALRIAETITA